MKQAIICILFCIFLYSCKVTGISTIWKQEQKRIQPYSNILVAAIIPSEDSSELIVENKIVEALNLKGYHAISNTKSFRFNGLSEMGEDNVYMTLCDAGIDAVLTFAYANDASAHSLKNGVNKKYVNFYFYNHIWNYRTLQNNKPSKHKKFSAELILFDLRTLESVCVLESKSPVKDISDPKLIRRFIKKLQQEEIIQLKGKPVQLKAF